MHLLTAVISPTMLSLFINKFNLTSYATLYKNCRSGSITAKRCNSCTARRTTAPRIRQRVVRWSLGRRGDDDGRVWSQVQGEESGRPWAGEPPVSLPPRPCSVTCSHPHTTPLQLWSHLTSPQFSSIHSQTLLPPASTTNRIYPHIQQQARTTNWDTLEHHIYQWLITYQRKEKSSITNPWQIFVKHVSIIWLSPWFLQRSYS